MSEEPIEYINPFVMKAVEICGSQAELGRLCNAKQQNVWKWLRMQKVTAESSVLIESATKGQVTRHDLRPDLFEPPVCPKCAGMAEAPTSPNPLA